MPEIQVDSVFVFEKFFRSAIIFFCGLTTDLSCCWESKLAINPKSLIFLFDDSKLEILWSSCPNSDFGVMRAVT